MPDTNTYSALLQCLAAASQIVAGFAMLAQVEASESYCHADDVCYPIFRALLEACRTVNDVAAHLGYMQPWTGLA